MKKCELSTQEYGYKTLEDRRLGAIVKFDRHDEQYSESGNFGIKSAQEGFTMPVGF